METSERKARRRWRVVRAGAVAVSTLGALLSSTPSDAQGAAFRVVVNEANPVSSLSAREVSELFLKKKQRFAHGFRALPVDQTLDSPTRASFSKAVHNRDVDAVRSYWLKMAFSGLGSPPQELASDAEVLDFVAHNVGGIGYVSAQTPLVGAVKAIRITELK